MKPTTHEATRNNHAAEIAAAKNQGTNGKLNRNMGNPATMLLIRFQKNPRAYLVPAMSLVGSWLPVLSTRRPAGHKFFLNEGVQSSIPAFPMGEQGRPSPRANPCSVNQLARSGQTRPNAATTDPALLAAASSQGCQQLPGGGKVLLKLASPGIALPDRTVCGPAA